MTRELRIFSMISLLALMGLGCKRPGTLNRPLPQNPGLRAEDSKKIVDPSIFEEREQPKPPLVAIPKNEPIGPEITYLQQVLRNLSLADSFRANMIIPAAGGPANASIAFKKSVGLYGTIEGQADSGKNKAEVFINQTDALYRSQGQTWIDMSGTEDGRKLAQLFATALLNQTSAGSILSSNASFLGAEETAEDCKRYDINQKINEAEQRISVCVRADLPTSIIVKGPAGELKVEYSDINGSVDVFRPKI